MTTTPRFRVMAKARPGALPVPAEKTISALTKSSVLTEDPWRVHPYTERMLPNL